MGKKNSKSEWTFNIDINPSVSLKKKIFIYVSTLN